jgi:hypothetical protein
MIWSCCATPREKTTRTFTFKNGTRVKALDSEHAIQILKSISLREIPEVMEIDENTWVVDFGKGVSIKLIEKGKEKASKLGAWTVYLDRRDLELLP